MMKWIAFAGFLATVPLANWMVGHVGTECIPNGPCLIAVAPGLMAPSGVLVIGLAFVLRDAVQQLSGARWAFAAILIGVALSALFAPPALVMASAAAYLLSEMADLGVYTPLRRHNLPLAVLASGVIGAFIDSAVFLLIAFGSLDYLGGQVIGKVWMSAAGAAALVGLKWFSEAKERQA